MVGVESRLASLRISNGSELLDEAFVGDDASDYRICIACVPGRKSQRVWFVNSWGVNGHSRK